MAEPDEQTLEQRIRERAYKLWDEVGRLGNKSTECWEKARAEIEAEIVAEQDKIIADARAENRKP